MRRGRFVNFWHEGLVEIDLMVIWSGGGTWLVASLEKTRVKSLYFKGRCTLGFAFLVAMASLVAVVSFATIGEFRRKCLQLPLRILLMRQLFRECWRY